MKEKKCATAFVNKIVSFEFNILDNWITGCTKGIELTISLFEDMHT